MATNQPLGARKSRKPASDRQLDSSPPESRERSVHESMVVPSDRASPPPKRKRRHESNVVDPRKRKPLPEVLDDPRPTPNRDMLAVYRRILQDPKTNVASDPRLKHIEGLPLTLATYRYTKNPSALNDNLGYGEQLTDVLWQPTPAENPTALAADHRISQRTRTGRQVLQPAEAPVRPIDKGAK
jgi:hypothetical protein